MRIDLRVKHDLESRRRAVELFDARRRLQAGGRGPVRPPRDRERMAVGIPGVRKRGAAVHGRETSQVHIRAEGRRGVGRGRRRDGEDRGHGRVRDQVEVPAGALVQALPRGRRRGAAARGPKGRPRGSEVEAPGPHPRAGARGALPQARGRGRLPKKIARPGRAGRALTRAAAEAVRALRAEGHALRHLLECAGLGEVDATTTRWRTRGGSDQARAAGTPRPRYSRAPPTAAGTGRSPCACAPSWARVVADKTVLKMMREMGIRLRDPPPRLDYHRYNSYRGHGRGAPSRTSSRARLRRRRAVAEDGHRRHRVQAALAARPTSRRCYDFGSEGDRGERHGRPRRTPTWPSSTRMLDRLASRPCPTGAAPVHALGHGLAVPARVRYACRRLEEAGIAQSMSRKGNCIDNAATEQLFGHMKDEFFRGRDVAGSFEYFKARPRGVHSPLEHAEAGRLN